MIENLSERDPVEELAEEFLERLRRHEPLTPEDYAQKFPALAERIRSVFPALQMLDELAPEVAGKRPADAPKQLGEFHIIRQIGRGGMGVVYEAVQESLDRRVALKILPAELARDGVYLDRFRSEARTAARLHHTNIVAVHGAGHSDGVHFLVMQLIDGVGLEAVIGQLRDARSPGTISAKSGETKITGDSAVVPVVSSPHHESDQLDLMRLHSANRSAYYRAVARLMAEAADALAHAHQLGVVHRDIKPSNLLLAGDGSIYVNDFGLAKAEGTADLTRTGLVVGTPRYLAPERFDGVEGPASDVFALGATLYELLTLRPAFDAPTREQLTEQVRNAEPVRPRSIMPDVPRDLETIALAALAKEPHRRPQSSDLAEDLRRWLDGMPIAARRVGPVERLLIWARRRPMVAALTTGLFLSLAAGLGVALFLWQTSEGHRALAETNAETADRRREESEETLNKALDAMDEYYQKVSQDKLLEAPGMQGLRRDLLASALPYYEAFLARHGDNPRLRVESLRAKASAARVKVSMDTMQNADSALQDVVAACRELAQEMPDNVVVRRELARNLESLARTKLSLNQTAKADALNRDAAAVYFQLGDSASQLNSVRALLAAADTSHNLNRPAQAQADMKEVRQRLDVLAVTLTDLPAYQHANAKAHINQASHWQKENPADACWSAEQACVILKGLVGKNPSRPGLLSDYASALNERGVAQRRLKRWNEARLSLEAGKAIFLKLQSDYPHEADYPTKLVANYRATALTEQDEGRFEDALVPLLNARKLLNDLIVADPADSRLIRIMAEVTGMMGFLYSKLNRDEDSLEANGAASDAFAKLYQREPQFIQLLTNVAVCRRNQALSCLLIHRPEDGARFARESIDCYLKALTTDPKTPIYKQAETRLYPAYRTLLDCHKQMGRWDLIEATFQEVLTTRPLSVTVRVNVAKNYAEFAGFALEPLGPPSQDQVQQFERLAARAVQTLRAAAEEDIEAVRQAFKFVQFQPIRHVEAFQKAVAEFDLPSKNAAN